MAVAAASRAEAECARALAQPHNPTPTMAMSLTQPLTVDAPANAEEPSAPVNQLLTPVQSGEQAAELTTMAAFV